MTANVRLADDGRTAEDRKSGGPAILLYSVTAGLIAFSAGAMASFAASSEAGKIILWSVVTGITATAAGAARESRRVRYLSRSVACWVRSAQHFQ
jgi:hypothetical protein